jgi:gamma-glutamyltranspeptidase
LENADGTFFLAIGGAGGSRIFPSVFQVLLNLDWGLDVREAIEFGRLHDQLYPLRVDAEDSYPKDILGNLRRRGHNVTGVVLSLFNVMCDDWFHFLIVGLVPSVVQAIVRKGPFIFGKLL